MILATNIAETSVTIAGIVYGRCWWVWLVGVVWHPPPSYLSNDCLYIHLQ